MAPAASESSEEDGSDDWGPPYDLSPMEMMAAARDTDVEEQGSLQRRLADRRAEVERLRVRVAETTAARDAARQSGAAGIAAAQRQMMRMRAELDAVSMDSMSVDGESAGLVKAPVLKEATEVDRERRLALQAEVRTLRHELSRWKHEAESLEGARPQHEEELAAAKAELVGVKDVLESTRHESKHHELETELCRLHQSREPSQSIQEVPLRGGGHGCVEASAEQAIRERAEHTADHLSAKMQNLSKIASAQQLAIQRAERQLLRGEHVLEQREASLASEDQRGARLKNALRRRSDDMVSKALGWPTGPPLRKSSSVPAGSAGGFSPASSGRRHPADVET